MAELACGGGGAAALRRCGGSGCTAAVRRRCGGSVTAAVRWQPAHTPCHKCANPKRQRGRSKREYRSRRDDAKETPIISCQAIPFEKKKSVSALLLHVVRLCIMAFPVVEFSRQGYKIRKVFG